MTTATQPKQMAIRLVPINKIKAAPWNPPNRLEERKLEKLAESISDIGLVYPVAIDENNQLVDGHRRLAVAKGMRWDAIPAIVITSEFAHSYGSLNDSQQRMSGNDLIGIYLSNPDALIKKQKRKIERIEEVCGKPCLQLLLKCGLTAGTFDIAMRVVRYTEAAVEPANALRWLIRHGLGGTMRHLLDAGIPKKTIVMAVQEDKPLKIKISAD